MRILAAFPMLALVIAAYNVMGLGGGMMQADSQFFDVVMPSGAQVFFKLGDVFVIAGLAALFLEILKAARLASGTIIDHMLSTAVFALALIEFLLVDYCGTPTFFLLTVMTLIDVVAGFSVSIFAARRDYSVNRDSGL